MSAPAVLRPGSEHAGGRIDSFLAAALEGVSRSAAQKLIEGGAVLVDGKRAAKNYKLTGREEIAVTLPEAADCPLLPQVFRGVRLYRPNITP